MVCHFASINYSVGLIFIPLCTIECFIPNGNYRIGDGDVYQVSAARKSICRYVLDIAANIESGKRSTVYK